MYDFDVNVQDSWYEFSVNFPGHYEGWFGLEWHADGDTNPVSAEHLENAFRDFFDSIAQNYSIEVSMRANATAQLADYYSAGSSGGDDEDEGGLFPPEDEEPPPEEEIPPGDGNDG